MESIKAKYEYFTGAKNVEIKPYNPTSSLQATGKRSDLPEHFYSVGSCYIGPDYVIDVFTEASLDYCVQQQKELDAHYAKQKAQYEKANSCQCPCCKAH